MNQPSADRFEKICFVHTGVPGDLGAFERALRLSERCGAELGVVSVVEIPPSGILRLMTAWGANTESITSASETSAETDRLLEAARSRGVQATGEVLRGPAMPSIVHKILQDGYDLLIKSAQPSMATRWVLFGHTDRQLIRKCPCPVWIEKPSGHPTHDRILAAVDPAPFREDPDLDPIQDALNTSILQLATLLARIEQAELHVVHVWPFDLERRLQHRAGLTDEAVAKVGESLRQEHQKALRKLVQPFLKDLSRVHLLKGTPGEEIPRLAAREFFDAVVMGTVCRSGLTGVMIGNTAETVLDQIDCSVVALKPPGFVSPVRL